MVSEPLSNIFGKRNQNYGSATQRCNVDQVKIANRITRFIGLLNQDLVGDIHLFSVGVTKPGSVDEVNFQIVMEEAICG